MQLGFSFRSFAAADWNLPLLSFLLMLFTSSDFSAAVTSAVLVPMLVLVLVPMPVAVTVAVTMSLAVRA